MIGGCSAFLSLSDTAPLQPRKSVLAEPRAIPDGRCRNEGVFAFTPLFQTHNGFCFLLENGSLRTDVGITPPSLPPPAALIMWLLHDRRSRRYSPRLSSSHSTLRLSALPPLRLSGCPSGRMSAIDLHQQHFCSDAGLWLVPNRIQ